MRLEHELVKERGTDHGSPEATVRVQRPGRTSDLLQCYALRDFMHSSSSSVINSGFGPRVRLRSALTSSVLRLEDVHGPHDVLPADGALAHPLSTFGAGYHVTTFQQHAVDDGVHADATQVVISRQLSLDTICGWGGGKVLFFSYKASFQDH